MTFALALLQANPSALTASSVRGAWLVHGLLSFPDNFFQVTVRYQFLSV